MKPGNDRLRGEAAPEGQAVACTVRKDTGLTVTADRLPHYMGARLPAGTKLYTRPQSAAPVAELTDPALISLIARFLMERDEALTPDDYSDAERIESARLILKQVNEFAAPAPVAGDAVRRLPPLPQAFFDEFGIGADDRVQDYARAALAQDRASQAEAAGVPDGWRDLVQSLVDHIESETCAHENTHRGGSIWEICDDCGQAWADDRGGKPEFKWPVAVERANAMLTAAPTPAAEGEDNHD